MAEHIRVQVTGYGCYCGGNNPLCPSMNGHFNADCDRCRYQPDTCADCRKGNCTRLHRTERVWGESPEVCRQKMRTHWAQDHEPADLLEMLEGL